MNNNKFTKYLFLTGIIILVITACVELEENPKSFLAPNQFYQTESQVNAAIIGVYDVLDEMSMHGMRGMVAFGDAGADNTSEGEFITKSYNPPSINIDPGNTRFFDFYQLSYKAINRANAIVDRVPLSSELDQTFADQSVAEAKFLRAYMYFNLVRLWGDIVYFEHEATSLEDLDQARTPADEVFAAIISDLLDAEQYLDETGLGSGRAHKWAAKALLTKVYLTVGQYSDAASKSADVINSNKFSLVEEYNKLFRPENNELTQEILFAIQYGPEIRTALIDFLTPDLVSSYGPAIKPDDSLYQASLYEPGDLRKDWTIYDSIMWKGKWIDPYGLLFLKFAEEHMIDMVPEGQSGTMDFPVLRYADVLLMNSEAIAMRDGNPDNAYMGINLVRERAGLPPLSGLSQPNFLAKLLHERRVELVLEGHRWFDLKRFGKLYEVMSYFSGFHQHNTVYPLPSSALIANPSLTQNEGY